MELSILTYDDARACHILRLKQGLYAAETFTTTFTVCANPMCPCTELSFTCVPDGSSGGPTPSGPSALTFSLDVVEEKIARRRELYLHPQALRLAKAVMTDLQPEDWRMLYRYLVTVKVEETRKANLETLEPHFPPEVLCENGSTMVGYGEIFPFGPGFPFEMGGSRWLTDDQYCVNPECECTDAVIMFMSVPEETRRRVEIEDSLPAARYDYKTGQFSEVQPPGAGKPPLSALVQALKEAHPQLAAELKFRHHQLRILYQRALDAKRRTSRAAPARPKPGRNDPCPCGSGKKYKRCCGKERSLQESAGEGGAGAGQPRAEAAQEPDCRIERVGVKADRLPWEVTASALLSNEEREL